MAILRYAVYLLASISLSSCAILRPLDTAVLEPKDTSSTGQFNINTDFDLSFPTTGKVVPYTLVITNTTCNLDGSSRSRPCMLVNGQYPGPTLRAQWGDTLQVTIVNQMQNNGTSIHFHGVRQLNTPGSDGVNGITQCAIAPGDSATYSFQATQYGTSWYHSHTSVQYGDGVLGPIVFDGPATATYDTDLGPYLMNDWFGTMTAWQVATLSQDALDNFQGPPLPTSILINGTAKNPNGSGGQYSVTKIQHGKKYRLRLINASTLTYLRVSLDGHSMLVIAADFVPVQPFTTNWLLLGIGQRYDVVITATQSSGSYWFRANFPYSCYGLSPTNGTAIWTYDAKVSTPSSAPLSPEPADCVDQTVVPFWPGSVPSATYNNSLGVGITSAVVTPGGNNMVVWTLQNPIWTNYSDPTLGYLMRGDTSYPKLYNTIDTQAEGLWNYWLILNNITTPSIPHPIHLHGHDFYVIGSGVGSFVQSQAQLNWQHPIRRDTQSVPGNGWLALAFKSDNPGAWLMHCHIAFHISEGLGMQYIEAAKNTQFPNLAQYNKTCRNWNSYMAGEYYSVTQDSGL